jgi:hypothetical protein
MGFSKGSRSLSSECGASALEYCLCLFFILSLSVIYIRSIPYAGIHNPLFSVAYALNGGGSISTIMSGDDPTSGMNGWTAVLVPRPELPDAPPLD